MRDAWTEWWTGRRIRLISTEIQYYYSMGEKEMSVLDDLAKGLKPGKETRIPKNWVTEPLLGWSRSILSLPKPGSLGDYRKGLLHVHDMGDHYALHKDRIDPELNPWRHLAADAPKAFVEAVVFISVITLWFFLRRIKRI